MPIFFSALFLISLPVLVYHKYCTVLDVFEKPLLYNNRTYFFLFSSFRLLVSWGSIIAIWYYFNTTVAIIALALYFVVGASSLRIYYNKQIKKWYDQFVKIITKQNIDNEEDISSEEVHSEALRLAKKAVNKAMKGKSI